MKNSKNILFVLFIVLCQQSCIKEISPIRYYYIINNSNEIVEAANLFIVDEGGVNAGKKTLVLSFENVLPGTTSKIEVVDFKSISKSGKGTIELQYKRKNNSKSFSLRLQSYDDFIVDYDFPGTKEYNAGAIFILKTPNKYNNIDDVESLGLVKKGKIIKNKITYE